MGRWKEKQDYVIVITHPWGLYLICKRERIKGAFSLCLAHKTILYCRSCAAEWCGWFSWWKAFGFHAVKLERIYCADSRNLPCIPTLYKHNYDATNLEWAYFAIFLTYFSFW